MSTIHTNFPLGRLKDTPINPWKFTFSFYHLTGSKKKEAIFFSCLGILPIIGAFASIAGSRSRGLPALMHNNSIYIKQKIICLSLGAIRTILSLFGLGLIFFIIDLICTLVAYLIACIESKQTNSKNSSLSSLN